MIVTALLRLDAPLDFETFVELVEARALARDRLRARIVPPLAPFLRPRWRDDGNASVADHVEHVRLAGSGEGHLARVLSRIASEPLDRARPLWRMWLIDGDGDRSAIAVRIHHVIADGVALLGVLYGFSDEGAGSTVSHDVAAPLPRLRRPAATSSVARRSLRASSRGTPTLRRRSPDVPGGSKALAWSGPIRRRVDPSRSARRRRSHQRRRARRAGGRGAHARRAGWFAAEPARACARSRRAPARAGRARQPFRIAVRAASRSTSPVRSTA